MVYIFCPFFQEVIIKRWKTLKTRKDNYMEVKLFPGPRDEEKIAIIQNDLKTVIDDDYSEVIDKRFYGKDKRAWLDALFYACKYRDTAIEDQEEYFEWLLLDEEIDSFIDRLLGLTVQNR